MKDPDDAGATGDEFDPDAVLWVPGVDYVGGWRDATNAAEELSDALASAGLPTDSIQLRASTTADGSGAIRLTCSAATARDIALIARVAAVRLRRAS